MESPAVGPLLRLLPAAAPPQSLRVERPLFLQSGDELPAVGSELWLEFPELSEQFRVAARNPLQQSRCCVCGDGLAPQLEHRPRLQSLGVDTWVDRAVVRLAAGWSAV